jgi:hypothetical protein
MVSKYEKFLEDIVAGRRSVLKQAEDKPRARPHPGAAIYCAGYEFIKSCWEDGRDLRALRDLFEGRDGCLKEILARMVAAGQIEHSDNGGWQMTKPVQPAPAPKANVAPTPWPDKDDD